PRRFPCGFTLITRTAWCSRQLPLAALPSTRAIPDRTVFYVARPTRSILNSYFVHGIRSRIVSVNDPLQRSRLKIQVAFCLGVRQASHLSPVVNRIRTTIPFQTILN